MYIRMNYNIVMLTNVRYESKKVTQCNVITTAIQYFVKNCDYSTMLIKSCYLAATVKLQSVVMVICTGVIMNFTTTWPCICI